MGPTTPLQHSHPLLSTVHVAHMPVRPRITCTLLLSASAPARSQPSPKAFAAFTLKANSLLLYQAVLKGAVGEALLGLMVQSQKYQVGAGVCVWGGWV
jgi:hypothetical protein